MFYLDVVYFIFYFVWISTFFFGEKISKLKKNAISKSNEIKNKK